MNLFRFTLGIQTCRHSRPPWHTCKTQGKTDKTSATVSSVSDVMSLLTVNDSSSRCLPFFSENLADGGGLFRGEVRHANFEGTEVMSTLIFFPPRPFLISLSRKCSEQTFVISVSLNFVPTSSNLLQPLRSKVWIFRKIEEADSLSVGVYGSSLVAKRNTAINI